MNTSIQRKRCVNRSSFQPPKRMFVRTDTVRYQFAASNVNIRQGLSKVSDNEFYYHQKSGYLVFGSGDSARLVALCYAGAPGFVNDPSADHLRSKGPLPKGRYKIVEHEHPRFARPALRLDPEPENEMHGRSGFWIHGDNKKRNRTASSGCIVTTYHERVLIARRIASTGCSVLNVVE